MLVLTRLAGESIVIDNEIHIRVLNIEDGHVRIGIDAPADKTIYREELYLEIQNENKLAGKANQETISSFTEGMFHGVVKNSSENDDGKNQLVLNQEKE